MRNINSKCATCGKTKTSGYNKPHSLHRTKKIILPNLQKHDDKLICTRCLRTESKTTPFSSLLGSNQHKEHLEPHAV